jgi:hypothetical protein
MLGLCFIFAMAGCQNSASPTDTDRQVGPGIIHKPTDPPPRFRIYRSKLDEITSVVVSPKTTDEQLKSLLWLFREKVRSHRFKDLGITQPTETRSGKKGYSAGMIAVFRGEKCANEGFSDSPAPGPCGYGDHDSAVYQWGLLVDGVFDPDADSGGIFSADRAAKAIFSYKDHWRLPADVQAELDRQKKAEQEKGKLEQLSRKMFAEELEDRLTASGFDLTVRARDEQSEELALDSDIFKDTATRVEFLHSVLPKWRHDMCAAGFRQLRLTRGGLFSSGDAYLIGCK